jgi:hypothetical protein
MSKLKQELLARKKELEEKLAGYNEIKTELEDVNKALKALEPKQPKVTCNGCASGCDICRTGPYYR